MESEKAEIHRKSTEVTTRYDESSLKSTKIFLKELVKIEKNSRQHQD
jgi:hypothetical protein